MFRIGKVEKGYINFIEDAEVTRVPFQFNPAEVRVSTGWNWGKQNVPGRSHPFYSGGSGEGEEFSFTLQLDADRGTFDRRKRNFPLGNSVETFIARVNATDTSAVAGNLLEDLRPLIDKFTQFVRPGSPRGKPEGSYAVPRRAVINLGSVLSGEIGLDRIDTTVTKYGPQQNILKAVMEITGHVVEERNVTDRILVRRSQRLDRDLPDVDLQERQSSLPNREA